MDPLLAPSVITAISDPEFEGLVSRALFDQGWNVVSRVMNFAELQSAVSTNSERKLLIVFSTDLSDFSATEIERLSNSEISIIGYTDQAGNAKGYSSALARPTSPEDMILTILENIRFSGIRSPMLHSRVKCKAKVVAVGGIGHATANTTVAINLAQEFANLKVKTLLIEANFQAPAISALLDLRKLSSEPKWRQINEDLAVMEFTQETMADFEPRIDLAGESFEQIVIDLGSVAYLARELSDRRWSSLVKIWASRNADSFIFTTTSSFLGKKRYEEFEQSFSKISLQSDFYLVDTLLSSKRDREISSPVKGALRSATRWSLPWDLRSCQQAIADRATLLQVAERGALRKEIAKMAQAIGANSRK
jgi:hypothetical protein